MADIFLNKRKIYYSKYCVTFSSARGTFIYEFESKRKIIKEKLTINGKVYFTRNNEGEGTIYSDDMQRNYSFKVEENESVVSAKRDSLQHPCMEDLISWSNGVRYFEFGTALQKGNLLIQSDNLDEKLEKKNSTVTVETFYLGQKIEGFKEAVIEDMKEIGYDVDDIGIGVPKGISIDSNVPLKKDALVSVYVKESNLKCNTDQLIMSTGMYRSLSIIIALNYYIKNKLPSCILIDDIGEGLDYNRSQALVSLIIRKIKDTTVQLIMSTNDKFIMNNVDLEYWQIINRSGNVCEIINKDNSVDIFKDFQYMGLTNFDFFSSKFFINRKNYE